MPIQAERRDEHCRLTLGQWHFPHRHYLICLCQFKQKEQTNITYWPLVNDISLTVILSFVFANCSGEKGRTMKSDLGPMAFLSASLSHLSSAIQTEKREEYCRWTFGEEHLPHLHYLNCLCELQGGEEGDTVDCPLANGICVTVTDSVLCQLKQRKKTNIFDWRLAKGISLPLILSFIYANSSREKRWTPRIDQWAMALPSASFSHLFLTIRAERIGEHCGLTLCQLDFAQPHYRICLCQFNEREQTNTADCRLANCVFFSLSLQRKTSRR